MKVAWHKGTIGHEVEWIGAKLEVDNDRAYVKVSVTQAKVEEWGLLEALETKPLVARKPLQQFTGEMSWAAGFVPQLKPFVRMLYAAMATQPTKLQGQSQIYYRQVEPVLHWFRMFLWSIGTCGLERFVYAHTRRRCRLDFLVDASPWGEVRCV